MCEKYAPLFFHGETILTPVVANSNGGSRITDYQKLFSIENDQESHRNFRICMYMYVPGTWMTS